MGIRHVAIALLILGTVGPVQSQDDVRYGFKFGITSVSLLNEPGGSVGGEFNAGAFGVFPVQGALSALVSADYHRNASESRLGFRHLSFLAAPQYYVALGRSRIAFYGFVGPRLDVSEDDRYEDVILGASAGAGFELTESYIGPLLIEMRYDADMTPARSFQSAYPSPIDQRLRRLSLRLGFSF